MPLSALVSCTGNVFGGGGGGGSKVGDIFVMWYHLLTNVGSPLACNA